MKSGRILLILLILAAGIVIYVNKCGNDQSQSVSPSQKNQQPLLVNGLIVTSTAVEDKIYSSGTLLSDEEVEIRNEIPGKITALVFREGTRVKKGELLVKLYDEDFIAQLKKLESQKDIAEKTEARQKDLLEINGISKQDYELSQNQLASINADIELVRSQLSKTIIVAPFDGTIGLKTVSTGAFLAANTRIATIQATDSLKLEFSLPERYRNLINNYSEVSFTTESSEGIFKGKIYAFEPKIDLQTRSILVRAICSNKGGSLFPGAFAHVEIPLKKIDKAILIPTQALVPELKGEKVFIAKNGAASKVAVETGMRNDTAVEILSGINVGDTLIITGIMQMRPGMSLNVKVNNSAVTNK